MNVRVMANGVEVPPTPTRPHTGSFLLDLGWMHGSPRQPAGIKKEKVIGGDMQHQNGRLRLHGGELFDHPAINESGNPHKLSDALWDFSQFGAPAPSLRRLTNRATFFHEVKDDHQYALIINDGKKDTVIDLVDETLIQFDNRDPTPNINECDPDSLEPGAANEELPHLLMAVGLSVGGKQCILKVVPPFIPSPDTICQPCEMAECFMDF